MGNTESDDDDSEVLNKAIIPFRVRNNGFQVDYKIFKFNAFKKAKVDEATDTKYDDTFLELNTRSKIVGDIRKILTIRAETISEEYANLRRNYYSRIFFGIITFLIGLILTNIGLVQSELPKGRIMIIFGGLLLILCIITFIIVIYTDRRLKHLNKEFVCECVQILEKEKIVTWTASFQHILFDIIYPYNRKSGVGAVILTPNPYFDMINKPTLNNRIDKDINVNNPDSHRINMPAPNWVIEPSVSQSNENENRPFLEKHKVNIVKNKILSLLNPQQNINKNNDAINKENDELNQKFNDLISAAEESDRSTSSDSNNDDKNNEFNNKHFIIPPPSDEDDGDDEYEIDDVDEDDELNKNDNKPLLNIKNPQNNKKDNNNKNKCKLDKKSAPKAYTGFDDVSKENAEKIHGELVQNFFHQNPEEIEGHGEDTALQELIQMKEAKIII